MASNTQYTFARPPQSASFVHASACVWQNQPPTPTSAPQPAREGEQYPQAAQSLSTWQSEATQRFGPFAGGAPRHEQTADSPQSESTVHSS